MALAQLSQQYQVNPITISNWKSEMIERAADVFKGSHANEESASSIKSEKLYAKIGQLKVENDFLKKSAEIGSKRQRLEVISPRNRFLSIRRQCEILFVSRSSLYYAPKAEKPENQKMMQLMDKYLLAHPTEGGCLYGPLA